MDEKAQSAAEKTFGEIYIGIQDEDKPELDDDSESVKAQKILDGRQEKEEKMVLRKGESLALNILTIVAILLSILVFIALVYFAMTNFDISISKP